MAEVKWHDKVYIGVSLLGREDEMRIAVEEDACDHHLMIITFAVNGQDQLDIRKASGWAKRCTILSCPPAIVALASDKAEAVELVRTMLEESIKETGKADLRRYLGCPER